jgi:hypothetical protein
MSDCDKCGAHWMQSCDCEQVFFGTNKDASILEMNKKIKKLQAQLDKALRVIDMVEDNTKMPHQHKDYYERLCCLSERARELKEELKGGE